MNKSDRSHTLDLSVVISTWNNADELNRTLEALNKCIVPQDASWELVIVNNNCTDHTDEIIQNWSKRLPISSVSEPRQGLSHGRNAGVSAAKGQWILFADDDIRPSPKWLCEYHSAFGTWPEGYFFGGPLVSLFVGGRPPEELLSVATRAIRGVVMDYNKPSVTPRSFAGANWAVASRHLDATRAFDPALGLDSSSLEMKFGEESDLQSRLRASGLKALYLPQAEVRHVIPEWKCRPEYILDRAEASVLFNGRDTEFSLPLAIRLAVSTALYFILSSLKQATGEPAYRLRHGYRIRRGKLKAILRNKGWRHQKPASASSAS